MNTTQPTNSKPARRPARLLTVERAAWLTPNMVRVTFSGPELDDFPAGREGANCKIMLPSSDQSREDFAAQLAGAGPKPTTRTYTVRHFRRTPAELDIDFVVHGDQGPASRWARRAGPGDFCGFAGPGTVKVEQFEADWYLLAADMSALPVAAATLEAMPADAKGVAVFEIVSEADRQQIAAPAGIDMHWLVQPDPHVASPAQEKFIRGLDWPPGRVQTCIAGESGVIRSLRAFLRQEKALPRSDTYISGYWKIGLIEDEHQKVKRAED